MVARIHAFNSLIRPELTVRSSRRTKIIDWTLTTVQTTNMEQTAYDIFDSGLQCSRTAVAPVMNEYVTSDSAADLSNASQPLAQSGNTTINVL